MKLTSGISYSCNMVYVYTQTFHLINLLPGFVIGIFLRLIGNWLDLYVGTSIFRWEIIFFFILNVFFEDLSIIAANPTRDAFALLISLTHSILDFPVVITSSTIKTFDPFSILKPLLKINFPLTLSQKIVSFFKILPI